MKNTDKFYITLIGLSDRSPVLIEKEALNIFQPYSLHDYSADRIAASILRNLIHFYRVSMVRDCHGSFSGVWRTHWDQLCEHDSRYMESYLLTLYFKESVLNESETNSYLLYAENLPEPDHVLPEKYHCMYEIIRNLARIRSLSELEKTHKLYAASIAWHEYLRAIASAQESFSEKVLFYAENYLFLHQIRSINRREYSRKWGEEYDVYLQKHLRAGICLKTAKTLAKRDFIAAHPQNDENADICPGHSNPAIKRYHQAFLKAKF